ncbi:hypothetical protein Droror1_Dr00012018, partial [Drosera rotundifolia]
MLDCPCCSWSAVLVGVVVRIRADLRCKLDDMIEGVELYGCSWVEVGWVVDGCGSSTACRENCLVPEKP